MKEVRSNKLNDGNLDKATKAFFPKTGEWSSFCFQQDGHVDKINLPCHLRDAGWLASCLKQDQSLSLIDYNGVLEYVRTSDYFEKKRQEYELEIVKWQIEWMMTGGGRWISEQSFETDFSLMSSNCDLIFRQGVINTLSAIGMSEQVIEEGLEKYAHLWRDVAMESAFRYRFELDLGDLPTQMGITIPDFDNNHLQAWMTLRRYDYYQDHKDSVDRYGKVLPEMLLGEEAVAALREYVSMLSVDRLTEMNHYRRKVNQNKVLAKV